MGQGRPEPLDLVVWARDFLVGCAFHATTEDLVAVVAWALAEGGHTKNQAAWNPLNTTLKRPGSHAINSVGVQAYPSYAVGLEASVSTLMYHGGSRYPYIITALSAGTNADAVALAVGVSGWGTNGALMRSSEGRARTMVTGRGTLPQPGVGLPGGITVPGAGGGGPPAGGIIVPVPSLPSGPRLERVTVNGAKLTSDIIDSVISATLSLGGPGTVTSLELTVDDPEHRLLNSGLFNREPLIGYGPLKLQLSALEVNGGASGNGGLTVTAFPQVVQQMKRQVGPVLVPNVSPTEFVQLAAGSVGAKVFTQPSPRRGGVSVEGPDPNTNNGLAETVWAACVRLAGELGFVILEQAGVIFFGQPSWLISRLPGHVIRWAGDRTDDGIINHPVARFTTEDAITPVTVSVDVTADYAESRFFSQSLIALDGLGDRFNGWYILNTFDVDLADPTAVVTLNAATPSDPTPTPATTTPTTPTAPGPAIDVSGYSNPLRDIQGLHGGRVDEGVDYTGHGPVYAVGNGVVVVSRPSGFDGAFISYKLTDGPAAGKTIFFAEHITNLLPVGAPVTSTTKICDLLDGYPYCETGWAADRGYPAAAGTYYHEGDTTAHGDNFNQFMKQLGAPAGRNSTAITGSLPPGWPQWNPAPPGPHPPPIA